MKVLLCSPYDTSQTIAGGIAVWAKNIVDYYNDNPCNISLEIVPFNRKTSVDLKQSFFIRFKSGLGDYRASLKYLWTRLRKKDNDVLHLCTSASFSLLKDYLILRKAAKNGAKTIIHFHFGRIPELAVQRNWEWRLLCLVSKLANEIIVIDESSYKTMKEAGFNNVYYLPNPLSESVTKQIESEKDKIKRIPRKIMFVGHVIPTKGVFEVVEACKDLPNIELHIVGKATSTIVEEMRNIVGNDSKWLIFRGELPHDRVIEEMLSTDIFILPSYTEGFPNVILESMACGCHIISTTVGAIPEMLDIEGDNPCGICVQPKNVMELRKAIILSLDSPDIAESHTKYAVEKVNEEYSMQRVWQQLLRIWGK